MSERGGITLSEIRGQIELWPDTIRRVRASNIQRPIKPIITGAGTSAYAAMAIEPAWTGARAVPSTELFLDPRRFVPEDAFVVSVARSGDSPESIAVVEQIPWARHVAITCNARGALANHPRVEAIVLDPRTNDRGLAMTGSFTNLVLAGLTLAQGEHAQRALVPVPFEAYEAQARELAETVPGRVVALGSYPLFGAAREACLKVMEMTAGRIAVLAETFLGLRHGPLSFLRAETPVLCFLSSDPARVRYEWDLMAELQAKGLGRIIALEGAVPDEMRTPSAVVFAQLLAFHYSLRLGLDPDNPSPEGVINRVVQGVRIYD